MLQVIKKGPGRLLAVLALVLAVMLPALGLGAYLSGAKAAAPISIPKVPNNSTPQPLPFTQDWTNTGLITANDDWSGVPGIEGFLGDDASTTAADIDPRTIITPFITIDVIANQTNPNTLTNGGVAEFQITNPVVALQGSGAADFPNLVLYVDTTGQSNIRVQYNVRDIDGSADNAPQQVNLQYRVGNSGNFSNVTGGYIPDATTGPNLATQVTPIDVILPAAADNQPLVQLRVMTSNATGSDEWVGIDDISVTLGVIGTATPTGTATATPSGPQPTATNTATPTNTPSATPSPFPGPLRIRDIQGITHISPHVGQAVTNVPGIVTAKASNGFYFQDPSPDANVDTTEGIFVFTSSAPTVNVGDSLFVSGTVQEFRSSSPNGLTLTEIGSPSIITISSGNPLPTPVVIGTGGRIPPNMIIEDDTGCGDVEVCNTFDTSQDGIDFYESLEGMLVQVNNAVVVGPTNSFDETWVIGDNGANASVRTYRGGLVIRPNDFNPEKVIVEPITGGSPNFNVNDTFTQTIQGPMSYGFDTYRIEATSPLTATSGGLQREVAATPAPNEVVVANFNMENLAPTDPPSKFTGLANLIVNNLKSPDLIVAEEIQDNTGAVDDGVVDASLTYSMLVSSIVASGGPTYQVRQIDPVDDQDGGQPGGNIRQAFMYRTDRGLAFVDRPGGTSTNSTQVLNVGGVPQLLYSPGRINPTDPAWTASRKPLAGEFTYNGRTIFIIGNHFNSKGGDQPLFGHGQPPVLSSEVQRNQQATIVANFGGQIFSIDANSHLLVMGDLNDYEFANPLLILKSIGLNALVELLPQDHRYSYVFQGNSQDLDHILSSNSLLAALSQYAPIHVNAEFAVQTSDHDPEIARFLLPVPATATPTATRTSTATNTATSTNTPSRTPTSTNTPSNTPTSTNTPSNTPTQTSTSTNTPTNTPTSTNTPTNTPTSTNTPSRTPTSTNTPSNTPTSTNTPSNTPTNTPTSTNTPTNTPSRTPTPTNSPTNTATRTPTPTNTPTNTPSNTPTSTWTTVPSSTATDTPTLTPSPTSTLPPTSTPTDTPTDTATPVPTSTVCPITFSDVPPGSTFYIWIRCLACRGIINGYPDGTFQPNNNVTRGQLSKIVSNAAGFSDPQPNQMFQDVPVGSTFQVYIGRLASRGYITGYVCGLPGEPCIPPNNMPYFRPNNNATRGQIAKIVSNSAGFNDPPVGQTFEDVPIGSVFYDFVERLASRGVMSGYPCGGFEEPCVPPENRPYFRPFNNATRGQTSKIVANTFYPACDTPRRR